MTREHRDITQYLALDIFEFTMKAHDDYDIRLCAYRCKGSSDLPLFLYTHGGGFVTDLLETDDRLCRLLATEVGICILNIKYRLAP